MTDLLVDPLWQEEDLGKPLPDSPHAVSVCMPHWQHVIGYEEQEATVLEKLFCGYPRFFRHRYVTELLQVARGQFCAAGEDCLVFPSHSPAQRCLEYLRRKAGEGEIGRVEEFGSNGLQVVVVPDRHFRFATNYWRFCGEVVSSRAARETLDRTTPGDSGERGRAAKREVRKRLARFSGQGEEGVFLFPSGMAAVATIQRMLTACFPDKPTIQLDFPYVDVFKVQREFGVGAELALVDRDGRIDTSIERRIRDGGLAGVYGEVASNPLLRTVDVTGVSGLARESGVPLVIDDTVGTAVNVDVYGHADVVTTSLTKYFSGCGDVLAGSVIIPDGSVFRAMFLNFLQDQCDDDLWWSDAVALEENSRNFSERVHRINANGMAMFDYLSEHPKVSRVYYPVSEARSAYDALRRPDGGYGGLLSIDLTGGERGAEAFYNALRVCKGPSLGTDFTLVCPYTILAHYDELDWAQSCGVGRNLVRISVGLEDFADLRERFEAAFAAMAD